MGSQLTDTVARVESSLNKGLVFEAFNLAVESRQVFPEDVRLVQLQGLALARLGATDRARTCLEELYQKGHRDSETIGILARVYKDIAKRTGNIDSARHSRDTYLEGFEDTGAAYLGINAATMSFIVGDGERARELALRVVEAVGTETTDYWDLATLGEAFLLAGDTARAEEYYADAREAAGDDWGNLNSTYQQLCFIAEHEDVPASILKLFSPPGVVAFTGHMIDHPSRTEPRFPAVLADTVKEQIAAVLDEIDARIGYCSAACGADILFVEAMIERGAEVNVYLPFSVDDFLATSVSFAGAEWEERFRRVMDATAVKLVTEEGYFSTDELFTFVGDVVMGMAIVRAGLLATEPILVAVLAGGAEAEPGGTASLVERWPVKERVRLIDPTQVTPPAGAVPAASVEAAPPEPRFSAPPPGVDRSIRCILFADVVGVGPRHEEYAPFFMIELLRAVEERLDELESPPEILYTWGDAIFAVCARARDMVEFALLLDRVFATTDWSIDGEAAEVDIRVSLHAGPVFVGADPVTSRPNAYGTHINRTARMRPVTLPGCIFASEQLTSMLVVETGDLYRCEYVGQLELPEDLGLQDVYRISRRDDFSVLVTSFKRQRILSSGDDARHAAPALSDQILPGVASGIEATDGDQGSFEWLLPHMQAETFDSDEMLFTRGDKADKIFYVDKGLLRLQEYDQKVGEGDIVGEAEMFSPFHTRTCSALCETDIEARTISRERMIEFLYKKPAFLFQLIQLCVKRFIVNLADTIAAKERIESELKVATAIQASMLPRDLPDDRRFEIAATMEPAREVGGDFYDFFFINDRKFCVVIADVSGKGVPAALFMVVSKTLLKTEALRDLPPHEVLKRVNDRLVPDNDQCMFVTVFCAVLDVETGDLEYSCAGHNPPLLWRTGAEPGFMELQGSVVLGAMDGLEFPQHSVRLGPGDALLLYTDGVTEAENSELEQFTEARLAPLFDQLKERPTDDLIGGVRQDLAGFVGDAPQSDDITMLALRYRGDGLKV